MKVAEFYSNVHAKDAAYSGASYDVQRLLRINAVADWLSGIQGKTISLLDLGCGKGVFLRDFLMAIQRQDVQPGRVVGIDLLESPNHVWREIPGMFEFVRQNIDGEDLMCTTGSFDFVSCNHVLEHVFETEKLLCEIHRVLKPDGLALVSVPNIAAWINRLLLICAIQPLGTEIGTRSVTYGFPTTAAKARLARFAPAGHIRNFTPRGLRDICLTCGLEAVGWWNQDTSLWSRFTGWSGRMMGVILSPLAKQADKA